MTTESVTLEAALARLAAAIDRLEEAARAPQPLAIPVPGRAPSAAGRADPMMDTLRADLAARYFGAAPGATPAITPLVQPVPQVAALPMPDLATAAIGFAGPGTHAPVLPRKDEYSVHDLMGLHDDAFLRNAFLALLRREPDPAGFEHYRMALHDGRITRGEVLCDLRYSPEGRKAGVKVHGLGRMRAMRGFTGIPLIGRLIEVAVGAWRLPRLSRRLEREEAHTLRLQWDLQRQMHGLAVATEGAVLAVEQRRVQGLAAVAEALQRAERADRELAAFVAILAERVQELQGIAQGQRKWSGIFGEALATLDMAVRRLAEALAAGASREELLHGLRPVNEALTIVRSVEERIDAQRGSLALVEAAVKQLLLDDGRDGARAEAAVPGLDAFYRDFENRFRGSREDIKSRVEVYVRDVSAAVEATGAPAVDLGCGRGEWLELLGERGVMARGIDANAAMVRDCRARGLEVEEGDALGSLRLTADASVGAVTGFHIVEHLPFPVLVALFDQAFRVLKPGGIVVFETPNPENLQVGAFTFWYDPTHRHPLPPDMLSFVAEARGFARAEVRRLHPYAEWERLPAEGASPALRDRLDALLHGPRDYALVAYKP